MKAAAPEIVAHRGESHDAPENTLAAFRLAWQRGARTVELDVRVSSDGHVVVCHDADTRRTAGVGHVIAETPLEVLRGLDVGSYKGVAWAGERIPTLAEVLALVPPNGCVWLEVKSGPETVPLLSRYVQAAALRSDQFAVISFDEETVGLAREAFPDAETYLIASFRKGAKRGVWSPSMDELIERALALGATGINVHFVGPVSPKTVGTVHGRGLKLGVWTVDTPDIARRFVRAGVDTITSNRAAWLRAELGLASP